MYQRMGEATDHFTQTEVDELDRKSSREKRSLGSVKAATVIQIDTDKLQHLHNLNLCTKKDKLILMSCSRPQGCRRTIK